MSLVEIPKIKIKTDWDLNRGMIEAGKAPTTTDTLFHLFLHVLTVHYSHLHLHMLMDSALNNLWTYVNMDPHWPFTITGQNSHSKSISLMNLHYINKHMLYYTMAVFVLYYSGTEGQKGVLIHRLSAYCNMFSHNTKGKEIKLQLIICKFNIPVWVSHSTSARQQKLYSPIKHMAWGTPSCFIYC